MSQNAISKLWAFFGLTWLTRSFLFFLRSTGMDPKGDSFGILGYNARTIPALALPMDLFLMSIFLWLSVVWSRKVGGKTWAHRQPLFHFEQEDIDRDSFGGKLYQGCVFIVSLVAPLLFTTQMAARFFSGKVFINCNCTGGESGKCVLACSQLKGNVVVNSTSGHFDFAHLSSSEVMLRFGEGAGPQYFAALPWVYSAWFSALLLLWAFAVWSIFKGAEAVA